MIPTRRYLHVAQVTLEAMAPVSIATGAYDRRFDTLLVRDANGLPALPGSSTAGVIRSAFRARHGAERERRVFGPLAEDRDAGALADDAAEAEPAYEASRLTVSWGAAHDEHDRPVVGLRLSGLDAADEVLALLAAEQPASRDNVRISPVTGAVDGRGKFSRAGAPRGTRFTVELALASDGESDTDWNAVLEIVRDGLRIGGATRRGLGRLACKRIGARTFDLGTPGGRAAYAAYQADPAAALPEPKPGDASGSAPPRSRFRLTLVAEDLFRIGGGDRPIGRQVGAKPADAVPLTETVISWSGGRGSLQEMLLACPGSSIKGALAHRMAFHAARAAGECADDGIELWKASPVAVAPAEPVVPPPRPEVEALLGFVASEQGDDRAAQAGHVHIDDAYLPLPRTGGAGVATVAHNSIDRFSGGTRVGILFSEELLYRAEVPVEIEIGAGAPTDAGVRTAFAAAIRDLVEGRLSLGAGAAKGHGYFSGRIEEADAWAAWAEARA